MPYPPTLIAANANRHVGIIVLEWEPPTINPENVAKYNIYRSSTEFVVRNQPVATVNAAQLIYYDVFQLKDFGCTFYYIIESVDTAGDKSEEASNMLWATVVAPLVPELNRPADGSLVTEFPLILSWQTVIDDDLIGYLVQLSKTSDFSQQTQIQSRVDALNNTYKISYLNEGTWYWRVKALFDRNVESAWSNTSILLVEGSYQLTPFLLITPRVLTQGEVKLSYYLDTEAKIIVRLFNLRGQLVKIVDSGNKAPGLCEFIWDGRDTNGAVLRNGLYLVQMKIEASEKNTTIIKKVLVNR